MISHVLFFLKFNGTLDNHLLSLNYYNFLFFLTHTFFFFCLKTLKLYFYSVESNTMNWTIIFCLKENYNKMTCFFYVHWKSDSFFLRNKIVGYVFFSYKKFNLPSSSRTREILFNFFLRIYLELLLLWEEEFSVR